MKNGGKEEICEIVSAFITFETEDGYNEAMEIARGKSFLKKHEQMLLGSRMKILRAIEPANVVWENKHIKGLQVYQRMSRVIAIMIVILFFTFSIITEIQ